MGPALWSQADLPFVNIGISAGRPACFADGSTVDRGAPKGIRNLTCEFQEGSTNPGAYRIVAGQTACVVPAGTA